MFSSKIAPNFYILIFKEHIRHIYNALRLSTKTLSLSPWASSEAYCLKLNLKNRLWFISCYKLQNWWQGSLILQYNKFLDIGQSDNKETNKPLPSRSKL